MFKIWRPNKDIISGLEDAIERIQEQEKSNEKLRNKLKDKKEILKDELMVDYHQMEKIKDRYVQYYKLAPFHFIDEEELRDYNDFRNNHQSSREEPDENGNRTCRRADGFRSHIIFHYAPSMYYRNNIIVECPYCHTKRELGSGIDILVENDSPKNAED